MAQPNPTEMSAARVFWDGRLAGDDWPFSCRLDDQPLDRDAGHWQVDRHAAGLEAFHAGHGLRLRCRGRCYGDFPVMEWMPIPERRTARLIRYRRQS